MTWTHPVYEAIAQFVAAHTGLQFPANRREHTELAIRRAIERYRSRSDEHYLDLLQTDAAALDDLVGELTVGETYFFREPEQFEFLRREVLPELRRCRPPTHVFRVWSAGCATGEEAYSLAILFEQEGLGDRVRVLATDISRAALARAHQAVYNDWSLRGKGASAAGPYLTRQGKTYVLDDKIRRRVTLEYLNLAQDVYPSFASDTWGMDLILCRNVLIYLDPQTVPRVAGHLFQSLAPGGWFLTASSDPPLQDETPFVTMVRDAGVFYRRPPEPDGGERDSEEEAGDESSRDREGAVYLHLPPLPHDRGSIRPPPLAPSSDTRPGGEGGHAAERVRKLAGENVAEAERTCAANVERQPLATELRYLHAVLLMDLGRDDEAVQALRRVIYLDRSLAVAHFTLGALLERRDDRAGARAAYRNAAALCAACPAEEVVPFADGECAGRLARAAQFQLDLLDAGGEAKP